MSGIEHRATNLRDRQAVAIFEDLDRVITALTALGDADPDRPEVVLMASRVSLQSSPRFRTGPPPQPGASRGRHEFVALSAGRDRKGDADLPIELVEIGHVDGSGAVLASKGDLSDQFLGGHGDVAGLAVDFAMEKWIPKQQAAFLAREIEAGRILIWVRIRDPRQEALVCKALLRNSAHRVQVHDIRHT